METIKQLCPSTFAGTIDEAIMFLTAIKTDASAKGYTDIRIRGGRYECGEGVMLEFRVVGNKEQIEDTGCK